MGICHTLKWIDVISHILKKAPFCALTAKNKQRNFHEMRNDATPSCLSVDSQICGRAHSAHPYMLLIDSQICSETLSLAIDVTIIEEYFFFTEKIWSKLDTICGICAPKQISYQQGTWWIP